MTELLKRISSFCRRSKGSRLIVGNFFLTHLESVAIMTLEDIARKTGVSPSTITRTASEIGFKGYHGLQEEVREVVRRGMAPTERLESAKLPEGSFGYRESLRVDQENLSRVLGMNRDESIVESISLLSEAPRVFLAGSRSSYGPVSFMSFILAQIRPGVNVIREDEGRTVEQILELKEGDLLMAMTLPRYSEHLVNIVQERLNRGCGVISVSDSPASPLAHFAHVALFIPYESFSFFNSCVCAMALFNALATGVGIRLGASALERLKRHNELLDRRNEVVTSRPERIGGSRRT